MKWGVLIGGMGNLHHEIIHDLGSEDNIDFLMTISYASLGII